MTLCGTAIIPDPATLRQCLWRRLGAAGRELHCAVQAVLTEWPDRLIAEAQESFPERVTAFRPEMPVHGRYGRPCPTCGTSVQHVVYSDNDCNYCPRCQTGGKVLADRALSRLLEDAWPRSVEDLDKPS